ncbi:MAG: amidohydrolase family protein [Gammaproteobacteria bacterium]|nr:amidohydrolase family protein [Gammaproteobacteria bacterium]
MNVCNKIPSTLILFIATTAAFAQDIAVRGERIYTAAGAVIENGVVIVRDGKIAAVGSSGEVSVPDGIDVLDAAVVTPGLIDAHTVVGMVGYLSQAGDQDYLERSAAIQPDLRAIDAYNAREPLVKWLRDFGITTIHSGHGPGETVSGQTLIAKTRGDTIADAVMEPAAMVAATIGEGAVMSGDGGRNTPGTRAKVAAMLRAELLNAQSYAEKTAAAEDDDEKEPPPRDLRMDVLAGVISGEMPLLVTANRHNDIMTALRIAEEFNINMILDGAAEAYLLLDEIKAAGVSVIVHPAMARASGERENLSFTTAAKLIEAGIPTAFQSGYEGYVPKTRVVLYEAAITLAHGVSFDQALAAITIDAAKILGIDDRVGSIEVGKDGDLALYDGDPFEYTSHAIGTIIDGVHVSATVK